MHESVLIVGGGIAGLTVARLLRRAGIGFRLLEARDRPGGRILSVDAAGVASADGFDLGPSWFWPGAQPAIAGLIEELRIPVFPQYSEGDGLFQWSPREPAQRFPGASDAWPSMRVAGGVGAVISALAAELPAGSVRFDARVTGISMDGNAIAVTWANGDGREEHVRAPYVILAVPPRLLQATVAFHPALEPQIARRWRDTPTWMAPHAKAVFVYNRPFWREAGFSGAVRSSIGPMSEVHDATTASGQAALFGFVGVPAGHRQAAGDEAVIAACVRQLASLFGADAAQPVATLYKDWATDPLTATADDRTPGDHPEPGRRPWVGPEWDGRLLLAGSETSPNEPGYLAGAVTAATMTVEGLLRRMDAIGISEVP